jgi:hypothetical protein
MKLSVALPQQAVSSLISAVHHFSAYGCLWVLCGYLHSMKNPSYEEPVGSGSLKMIKIKKRLESSLNLISFRIFIMNLKNCLDNHQSSVPSCLTSGKKSNKKTPWQNVLTSAQHWCLWMRDSENNKHLLAAEIMPWTLGIITSKVPLKTFFSLN